MVPNYFDVFIYCATYNQISYITDCLNGYVLQKTSFPFIVCVLDDASTDGEQELLCKYIKENCDFIDNLFIKNCETDYAHVYFARHRINQNCYFWIQNLKKNTFLKRKLRWSYMEPYWSHCKYHAICEGDDYWIDENKLQRQYEFMELHPDYSCCFHAAQLLYPDGHLEEEHRYQEDNDDCPMSDAIKYGGPYMATNSMFYVAEKYLRDQPDWLLSAPIGDGPMMLLLTHRGKVAYMDDVMSVYRVSAANSWSKRMKSHKKAWHHHWAINRTWKDFDKWSEKKYHKIVKARIKIRNKAYYKSLIYDLKCKLFPNVSFHNLFKKHRTY